MDDRMIMCPLMDFFNHSDDGVGTCSVHQEDC